VGVTGQFISDYLYWDTGGVTWAVGSANVHLGRGATCGPVGATGCVAIGMSAGSTGTINTIAIGHHAGRVAQGANSIAIGFKAAPDNDTSASSANTISIGGTSGCILSESCDYAIAVGACAGQDCRIGSIAIGNRANSGNTGTIDSSYSVVIGSLAGSMGVGQQAIVIGNNAASVQAAGQSSVIIGPGAGTTLPGAVVIGSAASCGGGLTNGVVINGSNGILGATGTTGGFWVKPVRQITGGVGSMITEGFTGPVYYNISTGEFAVSLA
jgi:hypothetical protein